MGTPLGVSPEDWPGACKSVFIGGGHHRAAVSSRLLSLHQLADVESYWGEVNDLSRKAALWLIPMSRSSVCISVETSGPTRFSRKGAPVSVNTVQRWLQVQVDPGALVVFLGPGLSPRQSPSCGFVLRPK